MAKFDDFMSGVKTGIIDIATKEAKDYLGAAQADGHAFLDALKADLQTWTQQLASGALSPGDFAFLVRGKKDLATMNALTQAGLAAIRIDKIRAAVIELIITAAGKMV
jgi:hypothetical protein